MYFSHKVIFLNLGENFFFSSGWLRSGLCLYLFFLWNFKCFTHISDSVRWKRNLQMQIWLCFKSALCCFAAYLWEMIVLYYKVSCIHIFIKCGLINPEFLQPLFFSHLFFFARKVQQKHPKLILSIYQPKTVLSRDSDVWWCLCVLSLWRPIKSQSTVLSFQVSCIVCVIDH